MKVPQSIGDIYDEQHAQIQRLAVSAENLLRGRLRREWHYEHRIKERESFALKIETGRVADLRRMEDFFACTIVVRNIAEIGQVEEIVRANFDVAERRPPRADHTRSEPDTFRFDHLRLFVRWRDDERLPPSEFAAAGLVFEIQVKSYLQHAWAIATHDLIYKADDVSWAKARIAYQVKAMLDHAETSIAHAGLLADATVLRISNEHFDQTQATVELIKQNWQEDPARLPADVRRLAEIILDLIRAIHITVEDLRADLLAEREEGRGALIETLSPFGIVVQTLLRRREAAMKAMLTERRPRQRLRVVISAEIELPDSIKAADCRNAIFVADFTNASIGASIVDQLAE